MGSKDSKVVLGNGRLVKELLVAKNAAEAAGNARIKELHDRSAEGAPVQEDCGNATLLVKLDGRTSKGKEFLKAAEEAGIGVGRMSGRRMRGLYAVQVGEKFQVDPTVNLQNISIHEKAAEAFATHVEESLGIHMSVAPMRD